jgi:hypothetical protein
VEQFSYAVATEGFVYGEGWSEGGRDAGYMGSDVAVEGTGFDWRLVRGWEGVGEYLGGWLVLDIRGHSRRGLDLRRRHYRQGMFH